MISCGPAWKSKLITVGNACSLRFPAVGLFYKIDADAACESSVLPGHGCAVPAGWPFPTWLLTLRKLGFGRNKFEKSPEQWARNFIDYIHDWCHYRPFEDLVRAYRRQGFTFESYEVDYVRFRLAHHGRQRWISTLVFMEPLTRMLLR